MQRSLKNFTRVLLTGTALMTAMLLVWSCAHAQNEAASSLVKVARVPDGGLQPQVLVQNGEVHLLYYKGKPAAGDLFYVHSEDGGQTFSAPLRVNSQAGSAIAMGTIRGGQLALGRNGWVYVVWNGSSTAEPRNSAAPAEIAKFGASPVLFARLAPKGTSFEPQRNLMTRTFNLDGGASVAADGEGRVYVAWHAHDQANANEASRRVWLATSSDDGQSFNKEQPIWNEPTGACGCCSLRVLAQKNNKVALLYRSATELVHRDTYYLTSSDGGKSFRGAKVHDWNIGACPMSSYALLPRGSQNLGAWESAEQIYFSPLEDDGRAIKIQAAPETGPNRKYPWLAMDKDGQTLLVWTQNTSWGKGGDLQWQAYDALLHPLPTQKGAQNGVPIWSFATAFARPDGGFTILY